MMWKCLSCPTLCNPMDYSLPDSSVYGIFQARILKWVAIPFSRRSSQPKDQTWVSCIIGGFFKVWAPRDSPGDYSLTLVIISQYIHKYLISVLSVSHLVMSDSLRPHGLYIAHQAPLSMELCRQECWNGLPFPSLGDLPNPGIEPGSSARQADFFTIWATREALVKVIFVNYKEKYVFCL